MIKKVTVRGVVVDPSTLGRMVAEKMPRAHETYTRVADAAAKFVGKQDDKYRKAVELCQHSGLDKGPCEHLQYRGEVPYCGQCGCPHSAKGIVGKLDECFDKESPRWSLKMLTGSG